MLLELLYPYAQPETRLYKSKLITELRGGMGGKRNKDRGGTKAFLNLFNGS